jgi:hypothetical protein
MFKETCEIILIVALSIIVQRNNSISIRRRGISRWQLEGGSKKRASYSEILERRWRHTLQAKLLRRGKTLTPPPLQPAQSISTSH